MQIRSHVDLCSLCVHTANSQAGGGETAKAVSCPRVEATKEERGEGGKEGGRAGWRRGHCPLSHPERPSDADGETLQEGRPFLGAPAGPLLRQVVGGKRTKLPVQAGAPGAGKAEAEAPRAPRSPPAPPASHPVPGAPRRPPIRLPSRLRVLREALPPKAPAAGCGGRRKMSCIGSPGAVKVLDVPPPLLKNLSFFFFFLSFLYI